MIGNSNRRVRSALLPVLLSSSVFLCLGLCLTATAHQVGEREALAWQPPMLKNCPGRMITGGSVPDYTIENAVGDGLAVQGSGMTLIHNPHILGASGNGMAVKGTGIITIQNPQIVGASGNGIDIAITPNPSTHVGVFNASIHNVAGNGLVLKGDYCEVIGGEIDGAGGVGLVVIGNNNQIRDVKIRNCQRPIVVEGVQNIVEWTTTPDRQQDSKPEHAEVLSP